MSVGLLVVRLLYCFYVFGHLSKWFTFSVFLSVIFCRVVVFYACTQRSSVAVVRDYGLHHYQYTLNFMRSKRLEYPMKPLLLLHFVGCSYLFSLLGGGGAFGGSLPSLISLGGGGGGGGGGVGFCGTLSLSLIIFNF
jgi:uncharacterized membrane protein YgcG